MSCSESSLGVVPCGRCRFTWGVLHASHSLVSSHWNTDFYFLYFSTLLYCRWNISFFFPVAIRITKLTFHKTEKNQGKAAAKRSRIPSLAETEEALAQAVWCWAGVATSVFLLMQLFFIPHCFPHPVVHERLSLWCSSDSCYSLLADDVLGSYLLCPHPKKPKCGSLIVRFPSGLITYLIVNTRKGKFLLEVIVLIFFLFLRKTYYWMLT